MNAQKEIEKRQAKNDQAFARRFTARARAWEREKAKGERLNQLIKRSNEAKIKYEPQYRSEIYPYIVGVLEHHITDNDLELIEAKVLEYEDQAKKAEEVKEAA